MLGSSVLHTASAHDHAMPHLYLHSARVFTQWLMPCVLISYIAYIPACAGPDYLILLRCTGGVFHPID